MNCCTNLRVSKPDGDVNASRPVSFSQRVTAFVSGIILWVHYLLPLASLSSLFLQQWI